MTIRHSCAIVCIVATLLAVPCGCSSRQDLAALRKFQEAEQSFAQAKAPDEFAKVAAQYQQILDNGVQSGTVLYNQGNAWMKAGKPGRAIACYRQAQRYRPRDPYLASNLQSALSAIQSSQPPVLENGVAGYVFFWQNWLSYREKFVITTLLLAATLLAALLSQLTRHRLLLRRLSMAGIALTVLFGISAAWDWHRFEYTQRGVVVADQVIARKGNSDNYERAFTSPLIEGTEFIVLERRHDWLHIRVGGSQTAWLPEHTVQLY